MTTGPVPYAGFVTRAMAFSIDALIALVVCTIGFQIALAVLNVFGTSSLWGGSGAAVGYVLALPLVFVAYCVTFWSLLGRTLGMMALGLRVVTVTQDPPGVRRSVIRAFGYWLSAILFLGFAWVIVDRRSQGFHDKLAGTFVIYDWGDRT